VAYVPGMLLLAGFRCVPRIFPNDASSTRLAGAMMLEQNEDWSLNRCYMQLEGLQSL